MDIIFARRRGLLVIVPKKPALLHNNSTVVYIYAFLPLSTYLHESYNQGVATRSSSHRSEASSGPMVQYAQSRKEIACQSACLFPHAEGEPSEAGSMVVELTSSGATVKTK